MLWLRRGSGARNFNLRSLMAGLALAVALNAGFGRVKTSPPRAFAMVLSPETAVESVGLLSVGMRRLAADLELIRLLLYYGYEDPAEGRQKHEHQAFDFDSEHPELSWGGGSYREFGPRARRILALDPSFSYVALYAAGAIAFNLNRPEEALGLLEEALKADPGNNEYRAYVAAIGFHRKADARRVLSVLEPTLSQPDCPTMIKSMMAFLYKRSGRRFEAIRLYRDIVATSRDAGYRGIARRMLADLGSGETDARAH